MYEERLTAGNALKIFSDYDVVIDGVDNFTAKFLINDACFFADKPLGPWRHSALRWPRDDHCAQAVRLLSLCLQNASAGRARRLVPGSGRDRRACRYHWHDPSDRSLETRSWDRPSFHDRLPGFRCTQNAVQGNQSEAQSRLRALRRTSRRLLNCSTTATRLQAVRSDRNHS